MTQTILYNPYALLFWDLKTVPYDIHTEIATWYWTPIDSHFWGSADSTYGYTYGVRDTIIPPLYTLTFWDVRTVPTDIHTEIGTHNTTPIHSQFWRLRGSTQGYTYGERDAIYYPYTLSFLETWGRGDSTYKYTYGDRDIIHHPYTLSILDTWGRGDSTQGYTYGDRDTIYHHYTLSFLETWGRGDSTQGYTYGDRDTIYHPYTLSFLETWERWDST